MQQLLQLADLVFGLVGELLGRISQNGRIFDNVLGIIPNPFQVPDAAVSAGEVRSVLFAQTAPAAEPDDKTDQLAVDEVQLPFIPVEKILAGKVQLHGHIQCAVDIFQGDIGHPQNFTFDLRNSHRRRSEHIFVHIAEGEFGFLGNGSFRNHPDHQRDQRTCQGQHHGHRHDVEERMEHGQLHLGSRREQSFKETPVGDVEPPQDQGRQQEQDYAGAVEQQVDEGGSLGIRPAGDTRDDRDHA